jgi:hypothetical protein
LDCLPRRWRIGKLQVIVEGFVDENFVAGIGSDRKVGVIGRVVQLCSFIAQGKSGLKAPLLRPEEEKSHQEKGEYHPSIRESIHHLLYLIR